EQFRIRDAGIDGAEEIRGALCASTRLLAGGRIGEIGALSGSDSIRCHSSALLGLRRFGMIVESAVIVVGNKYDRVLPIGSAANRIHYLRDKSLSSLYVGGRMLVIFQLYSEEAEIRIHEGDLRQRPE